MSITANNSVVVVKIYQKEKRKCGVCEEIGHNRRTCPKTDKASVSSDDSSVSYEVELVDSSIKEKVIPWNPYMFKVGGVITMPELIGWEPGTNSLQYYEEMKKNPFYKFDKKVNAFRKI